MKTSLRKELERKSDALIVIAKEGKVTTREQVFINFLTGVRGGNKMEELSPYQIEHTEEIYDMYFVDD
jgi:hypothetical protein